MGLSAVLSAPASAAPSSLALENTTCAAGADCNKERKKERKRERKREEREKGREKEGEGRCVCASL